MFVDLRRSWRTAARSVGWAVVASALVLAPVLVDSSTASTAYAAPVDCTPVGVEWIGNQLYYVEKCFGYNVYRPL